MGSGLGWAGLGWVGSGRFGLSRRTTEETVATELVVACLETADGGDDGLSKKTLVVLLIGKALI